MEIFDFREPFFYAFTFIICFFFAWKSHIDGSERHLIKIGKYAAYVAPAKNEKKQNKKINKNNVFIGTNLTTGVCEHHQNLFFALKIQIKKKFSKKAFIRPSCIESQILGF